MFFFCFYLKDKNQVKTLAFELTVNYSTTGCQHFNTKTTIIIFFIYLKFLFISIINPINQYSKL